MLAEDLDVLEKLVQQIGDVALITIDPITAYMGGRIDSHKTTEVRAQLGPLKDFAEKMNIAISTVTHPPKSSSQKAIDHFIGSQAFIAAGRLGHLCIAEMEEDEHGNNMETRRVLFTHAKHNPTVKMPTLAFRKEGFNLYGGTDSPWDIINAPRVVWEKNPVEITADEAVRVMNGSGESHRQQSKARAFLEKLLENGEPILVKCIYDEGAKQGFSVDQLKRAKGKLQGVVSNQIAGGWTWQLLRF